jgi:hypothetical protein
VITDDEILVALKAAGIPRERPWAHDVGPYDVTEPTYALKRFVEEIKKRGTLRKALNEIANDKSCACHTEIAANALL